MGAPKGGAPKGGARTWGAQNFALFSLSRLNFNSFFFLVGVFSWNSGVLKRQALKCARLEFSAVVWPPSD